MANLNQPPSRITPNLLHILDAFTDGTNSVVNTIVELNSNTINKYELITETGHLKLDRVGYSSLAYPFAYGCIPRTWDEDGDPCLLYTSPSPRDRQKSRMPSSA